MAMALVIVVASAMIMAMAMVMIIAMAFGSPTSSTPVIGVVGTTLMLRIGALVPLSCWPKTGSSSMPSTTRLNPHRWRHQILLLLRPSLDVFTTSTLG